MGDSSGGGDRRDASGGGEVGNSSGGGDRGDSSSGGDRGDASGGGDKGVSSGGDGGDSSGGEKGDSSSGEKGDDSGGGDRGDSSGGGERGDSSGGGDRRDASGGGDVGASSGGGDRGDSSGGGSSGISSFRGASSWGSSRAPALPADTTHYALPSSAGLHRKHGVWGKAETGPCHRNRRGLLAGALKPYSPSGLASQCRGPGSLGCIEVTCPPFGCPSHATYRASGSSVGVSPGSGGENLQRVQGSRHRGSRQLSTPREHAGARHECYGWYRPAEGSPPQVSLLLHNPGQPQDFCSPIPISVRPQRSPATDRGMLLSNRTDRLSSLGFVTAVTERVVLKPLRVGIQLR